MKAKLSIDLFHPIHVYKSHSYAEMQLQSIHKSMLLALKEIRKLDTFSVQAA